MLLHELFADADLLNEFLGHSILVTVRRKVVAFKPDSRLPNITLKLVGSQETGCSIELHSVLTSLISK
ncbi:hypothetical protein OIU79_006803 [Salix purpurea]|uniref:Uncharacterized protein n=2 Tax=Salix TaxID=40685 RepID=A0A9Q0Z2Q3_SALPP|nr:hypothetical protein OIU79_006803 [Salix purpurea]KAJ6771753.1 hypothetical protein OIU74_018069 [Salix koriyanagi]